MKEAKNNSHRKRRQWQPTDSVDVVAYALLIIGVAMLVRGIMLEPPSSMNEFIRTQYSSWTPGMVIDGFLLFILNRIIRSNEKKRVVSQVASLSNEFALDAVRRTRVEGWLHDGSLANQDLERARLTGADLSDADLSGSDLSFADLSNASLRHANLSDSNLVGVNLSGADLRWADMSNARLMWADLRLAQFEGAVLADVDATCASIDEQASNEAAFSNAIVGGYLTTSQIKLIRSSFDMVADVGEPAVQHFYEKLFAALPEVRPMFPESMKRQTRKFFQSLRLIVSSLDHPERALVVLKQLGEKHRGYGVKHSYYEPVGAVLIETLDELLGESFNGQVKEAWIAAYTLISSVMALEADASPATVADR